MLSNSINWLVALAVVAMCAISVGCCGPCGPHGCGVGCAALDGGCNDCDGAYYGARPIPCGPVAQLRQFRRSLVCGGGCGETYYGEWISTPPDSSDPCCGDQFVGGATKCTPFCRPDCRRCGIVRAAAAGLYGKRFCDGSESCESCEGGGCDSYVSSEFVESVPIYESSPVYESSGCSTCDARAAAGSTRVAGQHIHSAPVNTARANVSGGRIYR